MKWFCLILVLVKIFCDFCEIYLEGCVMVLFWFCDYKIISCNIIVECFNCVNYWFLILWFYFCVVLRCGCIVYCWYVDSYLISYGGLKCDFCVLIISKRGLCDVDVFLGYFCLECKNWECCVGSVWMEIRLNIFLNEKWWFWYGCSMCYVMN